MAKKVKETEEVPEEEPTPEPKQKVVYTSRGPMYRMPDGSLEPAKLD
jgi:hypothetical protein